MQYFQKIDCQFTKYITLYSLWGVRDLTKTVSYAHDVRQFLVVKISSLLIVEDL